MPDRPDLADRLLAPEAYPHAVVTPIRVVETHISRVLLTGTYAYKIKKPVRLSFLDYSTLAKRRACCEEEVRLNRRYAPDLYLGVSTVGGPATAPRIDAGGEPVEYAVRMRQFDRQDELGALLATHGVDAAELAALGEHVARFHASAAPVVATSSFGTADAVRKIILDNFASLRSLPEAAQWQETVQALEQWVELAHERLATLISSRRDSGLVRECHGDLHCGNVVRWDGALVPFDGIEFDPALRFIDVANDIAFLTMDLAMHDRRDLRHAVLQAWTQTLGDFGGLPLLPYFETYRALVRAKVAALRAMQEQGGSQQRSLECGTAARYLAWAVGRARRPPPCLVLTCGLSGSGKTSVARAVATPLRALHVRSDVERKRLAGLGPLDDSRSPPDGGIYSLDYTERTYSRLQDCATSALLGGESVIVDAAFLKRDERREMLGLARRMAVPFAILHCVAPLAVLRDRLESRSRSGSDASEAGVAILDRQPGYWEDFDDEEQAKVVAVDTTAPDVATTALDELRALGVG
jgi:aminoglycoside phosphotransferase family enzyme/predicted kinase